MAVTGSLGLEKLLHFALQARIDAGAQLLAGLEVFLTRIGKSWLLDTGPMPAASPLAAQTVLPPPDLASRQGDFKAGPAAIEEPQGLVGKVCFSDG